MGVIIINKKILIGSIFVLILLLLMPSISAIQQKIIKDKICNDLIEKFDFKDIKEIIGFPDVKHPLLFTLIVIIFNLRAMPASILLFLAYFSNDHQDRSMKRPFIAIRGWWVMFTAWLWASIWVTISEKLGWDWELYLPV